MDFRRVSIPRFLAVLAFVLLPAAATAHRLDELLQATLASVEPERVHLELRLAPGVDVAARFLATLDRDTNGVLSTPEALLAAESALQSITVTLDDRPLPLPLRLVDHETASEADLRTGLGVFRIRATAVLDAMTPGSHLLTLSNRHLPELSVYLANALAPATPRITIQSQQRDERQTTLRIAYTLLPAIPRPSPPPSLRVYFIGNSVTDAVRYPEWASLAQRAGTSVTWGRHMIPGAPLEWLVAHPEDGFVEAPFGGWRRALTVFPWDAVSIQPFDRHLTGKDDQGGEAGDVAITARLARLAAAMNPDVQVYLYARWPRLTVRGRSVPFDITQFDPTQPGNSDLPSGLDDFATRWEARYTGDWDLTNETRDYFNNLLRDVRAATPDLRHPVRLVPVGHALALLHGEMRSGKIPGWTHVHQLYRDGIHLNEPGTFLVACVFFGTLLNQSPADLPADGYGRIPTELATAIRRAAWQAVQQEQLAHPSPMKP